MIRCAVALKQGNLAKTLEAADRGARYDLGIQNWVDFIRLYPLYIRGQAHLAAHQSAPAAEAFQKILDNPGSVNNEPIGSLAHLQLGRAYAMGGEPGKARTAYQDFFTLWKDADSDVPILIAAKKEYAALK